MNPRVRLVVPAALASVLALTALPAAGATSSSSDPLGRINHIVVIYEENHSFDNLYGGWEAVNGRASADAGHTTQIGQAGAPYHCLLQNDVNLTSPPLAADCTDMTTSTTFTDGNNLRQPLPEHSLLDRNLYPDDRPDVSAAGCLHGQRLQGRHRRSGRLHPGHRA